MQQVRSNGTRSRVNRDPDRRPAHEGTIAGFWPFPEGTRLVICGRRACPVPATLKAQRTRQRHHDTIEAGLAR